MNETIEWQEADGSNAVEIAGIADAISDLRVSGQPLVQIRQGLRQPAARPKNRGNLVNRLSFSVTYPPEATVLAAKQAIATRTAALLAAQATREQLVGEFSTLTWELSDAALESYEFSQIGVTVIGRFTFAGGAYSAS